MKKLKCFLFMIKVEIFFGCPFRWAVFLCFGLDAMTSAQAVGPHPDECIV